MSYAVELDNHIVTESDFMKEIQVVKHFITDKVADSIGRGSNRIYWLRNNNVTNTGTYFIKTTMSDLLSINDGKIDFTWIDEFDGTLSLFRLREPQKKEFRDVLKFLPPGCVVIDGGLIGHYNNNIDDIQIFPFKYAVRQDEKYLIASCDNAYNNDEVGVDYDYIMKNTWRFPCLKRGIVKDVSLVPPKFKTTGSFELSQRIQSGICQYWEAEHSWGIAFHWKDIKFIFPMSRESVYNVLKNRDRVNGRKQNLPTTVREHTRNNKGVPRHLTNINGIGNEFSITMHGERFSVVIGTDEIESHVFNRDRGIVSVKKHVKNTNGEPSIGKHIEFATPTLVCERR